MKKFALITMTLLVLIIGVACVSATDTNGTIDDTHQSIDHQCDVCKIDNSVNAVDRPSSDVGQDAADSSSVNSADNANVVDRPSCEVAQNDAVVEINSSALKPVTDLSKINSTVTVENSNQTNPNLNKTVKNIIDDTPKETDTSAQKQNSLRPDIAKYNKYFQKNHYKTMPNGKKFSEKDLLLEISKHYSFEDTVIIALHVLRDNGVRVTFTGLEATLKQMADGTVYTQDYENNASYYKDEMQKIHESHKALNVKADKYSDILKDMNAKIPSDKLKSYVLYDFITHVYKDTFDKEQTALIAAYALKNCGYNVTVGSIENTLNQMIQGPITIGNDHSQTNIYHGLFKMLDILHGYGYSQDIVDLQYQTFINLRNQQYA